MFLLYLSNMTFYVSYLFLYRNLKYIKEPKLFMKQLKLSHLKF